MLEGISSSIDTSINSVSDLIELYCSARYLLQYLEGMGEDITSYDSLIDTYATNKYNSYLGYVQGMIDSLYNAINSYLYNGTNIASYQHGAISSNINMLNLYENVQLCAESIETNKEAIEEASKLQTEIYEEMQAEYEAACKAREDKGIVNMIMGGIAIFTGVVAIIGTAGMATPIVATAAVTGTCSIAYGVSNGLEKGADFANTKVGEHIS